MDQAIYLDRMGISRWHLRSRQEAPSVATLSNVYCFRLGPLAEPRCLLLFDAEDHAAKEQDLAVAMVKAMQQPYAGGYEASFSLGSMPSVVVVVALGARAAAYALQQPLLQDKVIVAPSVSELLREPTLKAQAWKELQSAMRLLA